MSPDTYHLTLVHDTFDKSFRLDSSQCRYLLFYCSHYFQKGDDLIMDMNVIYLTCAGLDVHKKSVVAAICVTDPVTLEASYTVRTFSTNNSDIVLLRN